MIEIFDTHKFLFTLNYENKTKGLKIVFIDRNNKETKINLKKIEIGSSPITCKLYDDKNNRYLVPFLRIFKVYDENDQLIWEVDSNNSKKIKIIEKYE